MYHSTYVEIRRHLARVRALFCCVDAGNRTQVIKLGNRLPYALSHLAEPRIYFSFFRQSFMKPRLPLNLLTSEDDLERLVILIKPARKTKKIEGAWKRKESFVLESG